MADSIIIYSNRSAQAFDEVVFDQLLPFLFDNWLAVLLICVVVYLALTYKDTYYRLRRKYKNWQFRRKEARRAAAWKQTLKADADNGRR